MQYDGIYANIFYVQLSERLVSLGFMGDQSMLPVPLKTPHTSRDSHGTLRQPSRQPVEKFQQGLQPSSIQLRRRGKLTLQKYSRQIKPNLDCNNIYSN